MEAQGHVAVTKATHNEVPSTSQQMPTQDRTNETAAGHSDRLRKTMSQSMMESHSVDDHLLKELWFAKVIAKCPCLLCVIVLATLVLLALIIGAVIPPDLNEISDFDSRQRH